MLVEVLVGIVTINYAAAIRCLECTDMPHPQECLKTTTCSAHQECFVEEFVSSGGLILFNSGCRSKNRCSASGSLIGRRDNSHVNKTRADRRGTSDVKVCDQCCNSDFCNNQGCGKTALTQPLRGPVCFNCPVEEDPEKCRDLVECDQGQQCFLQVNTDFQWPTTLYKSGCASDRQCTILSLFAASGGGMVGRRATTSVNHCPRCCQDDFCNDSCRQNITIIAATTQPTIRPTTKPTIKLTTKATVKPTTRHTIKPTTRATINHTLKPTTRPTPKHTVKPTTRPTQKHTVKHTVKPTIKSTARHTVMHTHRHSVKHTTKHTNQPTTRSTLRHTAKHTHRHTVKHTTHPTTKLTTRPTTHRHTVKHTTKHTNQPTTRSTIRHTAKHTHRHTVKHTTHPTTKLTTRPTTHRHSVKHTTKHTNQHTTRSTIRHTAKHTHRHTVKHTTHPTTKLTTRPTTHRHTVKHTTKHTIQPTTRSTIRHTAKHTNRHTVKHTTHPTTKLTTRPTTRLATKPTTTPTTTMMTTSDPALACTKDHYIYDPKTSLCLKFHTGPLLNWTDADAKCHSEGGLLAILSTQQKQQDIAHFLSSERAYRNFYFWVGANDKNSVHTFSWTNGQPLIINSNPGADLTDANCVLISHKTGSSVYSTAKCRDKHAFICERTKSLRP